MRGSLWVANADRGSSLRSYNLECEDFANDDDYNVFLEQIEADSAPVTRGGSTECRASAILVTRASRHRMQFKPWLTGLKRSVLR